MLISSIVLVNSFLFSGFESRRFEHNLSIGQSACGYLIERSQETPRHCLRVGHRRTKRDDQGEILEYFQEEELKHQFCEEKTKKHLKSD